MVSDHSHTNLIVTMHVCGYYLKAAIIVFNEPQVWLLFKDDYYLGCGFYSNKYGTPSVTVSDYNSQAEFRDVCMQPLMHVLRCCSGVMIPQIMNTMIDCCFDDICSQRRRNHP